MILTCPSCSTQYVVKDGAIPPQGRQVRCAACKHSWHQYPEDLGDESGAGPDVGEDPATMISEAVAGEEKDSAPPAEVAEVSEDAPRPDYGTVEQADAEDADDESLAEATAIEPRSGPEAEERAYEEAVIEGAPAEAADDARGEWAPAGTSDADEEFSPFAYDEGEGRRRRPMLNLLVLLVAIIAAAALFWFFAPDSWKTRIGLAGSGASPLALVTTHMDRQRLESGNELLTVTGRVINPTGEEQPVPPIQAQLKSKSGQIVYRWTIAPPAQSLPPGTSQSFNSAEVNVPPGGEEITLTLGSAKS